MKPFTFKQIKDITDFLGDTDGYCGEFVNEARIKKMFNLMFEVNKMIETANLKREVFNTKHAKR